MEPAKILLVDDHALFRHGVRAIIERERDLQVVGEATSCHEALLLARELHPDLILMDICLSDGSGLETISTLKRGLPDGKIVVLTVHDEAENLFQAIQGGAEGFLSKGMRAKVLLESLRNIIWGGRHMLAESHLGRSQHTPEVKI